MILGNFAPDFTTISPKFSSLAPSALAICWGIFGGDARQKPRVREPVRLEPSPFRWVLGSFTWILNQVVASNRENFLRSCLLRFLVLNMSF